MRSSLPVSIPGLGVIYVYHEDELRLVDKVKKFIERGEIDSCIDLLTALEMLRKKRNVHAANVLDDRLAVVIANGKCPDLK